MTIIAWSQGQVAADSLECYGSCRSARPVQKLRKRNGIIFACTGTGALFEPLIEWYLNDCPKDQIPQSGDDYKDTKLLVFKDGRGFIVSPNVPHPAELYAPDAWGVAADMAIGAMEAGADARRAVEICIKRDVYVGGPIQVIDLEEPKVQEIAA